MSTSILFLLITTASTIAALLVIDACRNRTRRRRIRARIRALQPTQSVMRDWAKRR